MVPMQQKPGRRKLFFTAYVKSTVCERNFIVALLAPVLQIREFQDSKLGLDTDCSDMFSVLSFHPLRTDARIVL